MAFKFKKGQKVNVRLLEDLNQMFEGEVTDVNKTEFTITRNGEEKTFKFSEIAKK